MIIEPKNKIPTILICIDFLLVHCVLHHFPQT
jgi:hypothetical protein